MGSVIGADACRNCKFIAAVAPPPGGSPVPPMFACRRYPPTAAPAMVLVPQAFPVRNADGSTGAAPGFVMQPAGWLSEHPPVTPDHWCGEHRKGLLRGAIGGEPIQLPGGQA